MDLRDLMNADASGSAPAPPAMVCSAKACGARAVWALRWNNPTLHTPQRRKVWLACETHEVTLRDFLSMRGFYRDTVRIEDLLPTDG